MDMRLSQRSNNFRASNFAQSEWSDSTLIPNAEKKIREAVRWGSRKCLCRRLGAGVVKGALASCQFGRLKQVSAIVE